MQKQKALAAIDAVQNMADIARSKSPQPSIASPQTASIKLESMATNGLKHEAPLDTVGVKEEADDQGRAQQCLSKQRPDRLTG